MKYLILAIVCLATVGPTHKPDGKTNKNSDTANDKSNPTVTFVDNRTTTTEAKPAQQNPPNWFTTSAAAEWALFIAGTVGVIVALCTLSAINRQVGKMGRQEQLMFEQIKAMREQVTEMSVQSGILQESVVVARESANAAKISADIAARVAVPTLAIEEFKTGLTGAANLPDFLQEPQIKIVVKNCGQTPAFLKWWTIMFTTEELPDVPVYSGQAGCGVVLDKIIIEPTASHALPELYFPRRHKLKTQDVQAVIARQKELHVYGYICYGDLFGNPLKRLKFCETALNLGDAPPFIQWADFGYDDYTGTDQMSIRKAASGQRVKGQPISGDAKTQDHPEETN